MSNEREVKILAIANEIIEGSDSSFSLGYSEEYQKLDTKEQSEVNELVEEQIQSCGSCGWFFHVDTMEASIEFDAEVCWKCAGAELQEEEGDCQGCGNLHYVTELSRNGMCDDCEAWEEEDDD